MLVPVIANAGTTRMRVEYRQPRLKEGKNLATLNGEFIQPSEFFREIIAGFEKAYRFLGGGGNSEKDVFSRANKEAVSIHDSQLPVPNQSKSDTLRGQSSFHSAYPWNLTDS